MEHQLGATACEKQIELTVSVIVIHLGQHVDCVRIKCKIGAVDNTQHVELMAKSSFSKHELRGIGSIKTVNAVCSAYPIL